MRIEQAIFTSVRTDRLDGYQLAARSRGIDDDVARELTAWGPAHGSLLNDETDASSINYHTLSSGECCLSHTRLAGAEYSAREGARVYTQFFLLPREGFLRFGGNAFGLWRALIAAARVRVCDPVPQHLSSYPLVGSTSESDAPFLEQILAAIDAELLAELTEALQTRPAVSVASRLPYPRLFEAVLHLLPLPKRVEISFSTGLKFSSRRPFRLYVAPSDPAAQRQLSRQTGVSFFDLTMSVTSV